MGAGVFIDKKPWSQWVLCTLCMVTFTDCPLRFGCLGNRWPNETHLLTWANYGFSWFDLGILGWTKYITQQRHNKWRKAAYDIIQAFIYSNNRPNCPMWSISYDPFVLYTSILVIHSSSFYGIWTLRVFMVLHFHCCCQWKGNIYDVCYWDPSIARTLG